MNYFTKFCLTVAILSINFGAIAVLSSSSLKDISALEKSCHKSSNGVSKSSLVIVSTLDGKLTAFDAKNDGKIVWEMAGDGGPLLSSSLSSLKMSSQHASSLHLIPSLDGILFKLQGDQVEAVPLNTETLLDSNHPLPDGSILVGGRDASTCGVSPNTGKMRYTCNAQGCKLVDDKNVHISHDDVLVIRRNQRTVRAVDARTGHERWNYSVGIHDLSLALGNDELTGGPKCPGNDKTLDWQVQVSLMDHIIAVVRQGGPNPVTPTVMWTRQLSTPIAGAWILNGEYLQEVDLFSEDVLPKMIDSPVLRSSPSMYLGVHEGQTYIQTPREILTAINRASVKSVAVSHGSDKMVKNRHRFKLSWLPYLATSSSRTPTLVTKELAVWNSHEYPFDNGYYMFGKIQPIVPAHKDNKLNKLISEDTFKDWNSSKTCPDPKSDQIHSIVDERGSLLLWWKEVLALTACTSFLAQYFLWRFFFSKRKEKVVDTAIQRTYSHVSVGTTTASVSTYIDNEFQLPPSPLPVSPLAVENYSSRFLTDFTHEQCLGKGGFGVVFQSKNIIDECSYAVKRIRLPNCKEARDKVMREVKALAKLEHVGIVRYFNAWFEAPPMGWQEEQDRRMIEESSITCQSMFTFSEPMPNTRPRKVSSTKNDSTSKNRNTERKRTKSNGSCRSRYSSHNSTISSEDPLGKRFNAITGEEDMELLDIQGVHELSDQEDSQSLGIEFIEKNGLKNGYKLKKINTLDNSESFGIEFTDETGEFSGAQKYPEHDDSESFGIEFTDETGEFSDVAEGSGLTNDRSESFDIEFTEDSVKYAHLDDSESFGIEFTNNADDSSHEEGYSPLRTFEEIDSHDTGLLEEVLSDGPGGGNIRTVIHPSVTAVGSSDVAHHDESGSFSIEFAESSLDNGNSKDMAEGVDHVDEDDSEYLGETSEITGDSGNLTFECSSSTSKHGSHVSNNETSATNTGRSSQAIVPQRSSKSNNETSTQTIYGGPLFLFIQMQLCRRESLKTWLNQNLTSRNHIYCLRIFEQIVSAVEYFHGQGMIHRDLKPSNIFFSLDGVVKVGDFGLVTELDTDGTRNDSNGYTGQRHTGPVGTQLYMSPEQVIGKSYNLKVDIYSLGLIFFELFQSFNTQMERIKTLYSLRQQRFPQAFEQNKSKHAQFVGWLMSEDPSNRPSASDIRKSTLLNEIRQFEQNIQRHSFTDEQQALTHEQLNKQNEV